MIFLKNYFVTTTQGLDILPILHDVRYAIRDSQMKEGLVTITLPDEEAFLVVAQAAEPENPPTPQRSLSIPFRNGELLLEPKQGIYLFDQSRSGKRREFFVQVMGESAAPKERSAPRRTAR